MFEKVNPSHPDKVADRIAGAIVDLAYSKNSNPKVAVEVLLGHGECNIIIESSETFAIEEINSIVERITGQKMRINLNVVQQDKQLAKNQEGQIRCGDNGIFKGVPVTTEQRTLKDIAVRIYSKCPNDGKYIFDSIEGKLIICQSRCISEELAVDYPGAVINPLGNWTGGPDVDAGCTNRKLGSDMGDSVTGGGLHGKDLSKADVSVNIYAFLKAQLTHKEVKLCCAIGDQFVDGKPYEKIVDIAKAYIWSIGGFEKFAEWGLI